MNDIDYQITLECLRIAARLLMPLDLDGFLQRLAALESRHAQDESPGVPLLARIALALRDEGKTKTIGASDRFNTAPAQHSWPES